jgi:SAM-dependent methyltransferase
MDLPPVFFEIHSGLNREGPGSRASTERAISLLPPLPERPDVLDIGCGPGEQTLVLAERVGGAIVAVDNHAPFLEQLTMAADLLGLGERVQPRLGDMSALPFAPGSFDLLWAEGSIFILGAERALRLWRPLLREGGCLAFTEAVWLRDDPPDEVRDFWNAAYPEIATREQLADLLPRCGYELLESFALPESDWWDEYYTPITAKLPGLMEKHRGDEAAMEVLRMQEWEIEMFRKYAAYYGYVFYLGRAGGGDT